MLIFHSSPCPYIVSFLIQHSSFFEHQNALRQLRQEQQKVVKEQEHAANLKAEQEQLKIALTEAQRAREGLLKVLRTTY